jgi:hypothetical protein
MVAQGGFYSASRFLYVFMHMDPLGKSGLAIANPGPSHSLAMARPCAGLQAGARHGNCVKHLTRKRPRPSKKSAAPLTPNASLFPRSVDFTICS